MQRIKQLLAGVLCLFLTVAPVESAWAVIALVASSNGVAGGNSPSVTGKDWTGATLGIACVEADSGVGSGQTVSFTAGSTGTWTRAKLQGPTASQVELWYAPITSAAADTSINYTGNFSKIFVAAFSGTATSSVTDGGATGSNGNFITTIQPGSTAATQNGDLFITCMGLDASGSASETVDSGFTILDDSARGGCCFAGASAYFVQGTAGALNPQWGGFSSQTALATLQAFKDNSGGGGGSTGKPIMMGTP